MNNDEQDERMFSFTIHHLPFTIYHSQLTKCVRIKAFKLICGIVAKLLRANGGCLGVKCRRKTWKAAISFGEELNIL